MALFTLDGVLSFAFVFALQLLLALHNILALSVEARRAPPEEQADLRRLGIGIAIAMRVVALFVLLTLIASMEGSLVAISWRGVVEAAPTVSAVLFLAGGALVLTGAMKQIAHMLAIEHVETDVARKGQKSSTAALAGVCVANGVFSFAAVMAAIAITDDFLILSLAIVAAAMAMMALADRAAALLAAYRRAAVLGFFLLTLAGVQLLSMGGAAAELRLFDAGIEEIARPTFFFAAAAMAAAHLALGRYQRRLLAEKKAEIQRKT